MPGSVIRKIRNKIVPLTIIAVILAIAVYETTRALPVATPEYIVPRLLTLIAVLAGILPLPLVFLAGFFLLRPDTMVFLQSDTIPFVGILSAILGIAGYCAAQRTKEYLAVSVVLAGLWLVFFLSGIN
jgi:p-aminobenzoyl-glutamate transporter AbgT